VIAPIPTSGPRITQAPRRPVTFGQHNGCALGRHSLAHERDHEAGPKHTDRELEDEDLDRLEDKIREKYRAGRA
jgi:hypothetical protein